MSSNRTPEKGQRNVSEQRHPIASVPRRCPGSDGVPSEGFRPVAIWLPLHSDEVPALAATLAALSIQPLLATEVVIAPMGLDVAQVQRVEMDCAAAPMRWRKLRVLRGNSDHAVLGRLLRELPEHDLLRILPGLSLPAGWDRRLQAGAYSEAKLASISPFWDGASQVALFEPDQIPNRHAAPLESINHALRKLNLSGPIEIPLFASSCVYLRRDALDALPLLATESTMHDARLAKALRLAGYVHGLCPSVYVQAATRHANTSLPTATLLGEEPGSAIPDSLSRLREAFAELRSSVEGSPPDSTPSPPCQLHVMHSWEGGLHNWVREYCDADSSRSNLVLKSIGSEGAYGEQLVLYNHPDDDRPIGAWQVTPSIPATALTNLRYRQILEEIIDEHDVERVIISSFIGHSLDLLELDIATIVVLHDYYPTCPALHLYFGERCRSCDQTRLDRCIASNPLNRFFPGIASDQWLAIRHRYDELLRSRRPPVVAPTRSVRDNLISISTDLTEIDFRTIEHGTSDLDRHARRPARSMHETLRVVILGRLDEHKGLGLFEHAFSHLRETVELFLVGCGPQGKRFGQHPGVTVIESYQRRDLPRLLEDIQPDLGLLLSVVPETFSYVLSELWAFEIPPVATRVGALADRINDEENGFLFEPDPKHLCAIVTSLNQDRNRIERVRQALSMQPARSTLSMIQDYDQLAPPPDENRFIDPELLRKAAERLGRSDIVSLQPDAGIATVLRTIRLFMQRRANSASNLSPLQRTVARIAIQAWLYVPERALALFDRVRNR